MEEAEPLSDTSFQKTDPDSYYSAWSGMKTLLAKELVKKESNPPKFSLTEAGVALAVRLANADDSFSPTHNINEPSAMNGVPSTSSAPLRNGASHISRTNPEGGSRFHDISQLLSSDEDNDDLLPRPTAKPSSTRAESPVTTASKLQTISNPPRTSSPFASSACPFPFIYLDYDHNEVSDKDSAAVTFDSVVQAGFLVKCRKPELLASGIRYSPFEDDARRRSLSGGKGDYFMAYLANDDCPEVAPGLGEEVVDIPEVKKGKEAVSAKVIDVDTIHDGLSPPPLCAVKKKKKKRKKSGNRTMINVSFADVLTDSDDDLPPALVSPKPPPSAPAPATTVASKSTPTKKRNSINVSFADVLTDSDDDLPPTLVSQKPPSTAIATSHDLSKGAHASKAAPVVASSVSSTSTIAKGAVCSSAAMKEQPSMTKVKNHQRRKYVY